MLLAFYCETKSNMLAPVSHGTLEICPVRGRPRPHQPGGRPYDPSLSRKPCARALTGWDAQTTCLSPCRVSANAKDFLTQCPEDT